MGLIMIAVAPFAYPEVFGERWMWVGIVSMVPLGVAVFVGWWAVRLLVGAWVRGQPPDPLDR